MKVFQGVNKIFSAYIHDVNQCDSKFASFCLRSVFGKIHSLICDDFGKSDIIKPANVKLLHPDRKYPFHKINEPIELKFVLKNEGLGYGFDIKIEVMDADGLISEFNQTVATEMKIESINIILPVVVSSNKTKSPSLLIRYSWRNYENQHISEEELFEFESQKEDIDWDKLKFKRPYSLQAVETEEELVGRKELVENIYANLISDTIQSAMIFGQKRVGKTSIAQALANKIKKEIDFVPVFIKVGDLDKTSPKNFIKTLGEAIVEETLYHNELSKLGINKPVFDEVLSPPLANYFKRISRLMFTLLENVTFYSELKIREKLRIIHSFVKRNMIFSIKSDERRSREILLSSFDKPTKSSSSYARLYATENKVISHNVASLEDIPKSLDPDQDPDQRISTIVFIDDIIGSGGSIINGIEKLNQICGETIGKRNIKVVIATICGLESGKEAIERKVESEIPFEVEIYICDVLNDSHRCFTDNSLVFDDEVERKRAQEIAIKYGKKLDKKFPLGFDGGQLLIVFHDTCPNNSLPILRCLESSWIPLFRRH